MSTIKSTDNESIVIVNNKKYTLKGNKSVAVINDKVFCDGKLISEDDERVSDLTLWDRICEWWDDVVDDIEDLFD